MTGARALRRVPDRVRKATREPLEIGKNPIPPLIPQPAKGVLEILLVLHITGAEAFFG